MTAAAEKIVTSIQVEVDPEWIEFLMQYTDIFGSPHYCGYWMYGMERDNELGWLCYEHNDDCRPTQVAERKGYKAIVKKWREGKPLPKRWHRLNKDAAIKAWCEGVKHFGTDWFEHGDGPRYDFVVQLALLGEEKYG